MSLMSLKLAMPLLGMLLWVISIHSGTFGTASVNLLPRPLTGIGRSIHAQQQSLRDHRVNYPLQLSHMKISEKDLNQSISFGDSIVNRMRRLETNLGWSNIHVQKGTPSHGQFIAYSPEIEALEQGKDALVAAKATLHLMNSFCYKYNLNRKECTKFISTFKLKSTPLGDSCEKLEKQCTAEEVISEYRSIDGSCNHINDGQRGAAFTGYKRLLHPDYLDGVLEMRRAANKKPLPSARKISSVVAPQVRWKDSDVTLAVMQWSQFIEHDLSHTAASKMIHTDNSIECCAQSGTKLSPRYIHPFCSPISIPADDKYYAKLGLDCMSYTRSVIAHRPDCSFGPIDQVNQATHFLDGSQIYGSTAQKAKQLRTYVDGQLETTSKYDREFLPTSKKPSDDCQFDDISCFVSGDTRVNIQPQLTAMHTLWLREHNRIAQKLKELNPNWDDEMLYQEARKIVIAEIQQITYHEWIPEVLGKKYYHKIEKYSKYDEDANPSVSNSFATAAFRVMSTLINGKASLYQENRSMNKSQQLKNHLTKLDLVEEPGYLNALIYELATKTSQKLQDSLVDDLCNQLFFNGKYGLDSLSLDIQRGRDHGLPSYTEFRSLCGLSDIETFEDFKDAIPDKARELLEKTYDDPEDVDLIVGGLAERPMSDSLFGPTFSCIIADQFLRTRRGDRYFFTNQNQPAPFSHDQLKEIEKVTLARVFCDNGDNLKMMQPNVFKHITINNNLVECASIPQMDLDLWKDQLQDYY